MTALPSLISSASSSASEDTSSASVEVDNNIRASLTLPGPINNARAISSQPGHIRPIVRHQNGPRLGQTTDQLQNRHINRTDHNHYTPHGHQADNYFHLGNSNHVNKSATTAECNMSICYSYLLAAISSIMVVVGIYFSLTRFNLNYLYLSLAGLLLEAFGACLYCIGNVQLNRKARRKLSLSDDDFEAIDSRGLAAAAAASHILNSRGLVQINNNNLNPSALRVANQNLPTTTLDGTVNNDNNNNESLLVMVNASCEIGSMSSNPPTSAQVKKVPNEQSEHPAAISQVSHEANYQDNNNHQLIDDREALQSVTNQNNEVTISQLSLNMIPQYFSNGMSLRSNKSSQPGMTSSTVINLTSGAFGQIYKSEATSESNTKSFNANQATTDHEEPIASTSSVGVAAVSSQGSVSTEPNISSKQYINNYLLDKTTKEVSDTTAIGSLSQSQIVNVNGRQFLILPLNDKNTSPDEQSTTSDDTRIDSQRENTDTISATSRIHDAPGSDTQPYTQETTQELIDKIRTLTNSDNKQIFTNFHANHGQSPSSNLAGHPVLRRENSFTFNNAKVSLGHNPAAPLTPEIDKSPRSLRLSYSFNDKYAALSQKSKWDYAVKLCAQVSRQESAPCEPSTSRACLQDNSHASSSCIKETIRPVKKKDDLTQSGQSRNQGNIDGSETIGTSTASTSANSSNKQLTTEPSVQQSSVSLQYDRQPSISSNFDQEKKNVKKSNAGQRGTKSDAHRTTLVMGLSGEEELIEINEADIDDMSILPPSYESLMGQPCSSIDH